VLKHYFMNCNFQQDLVHTCALFNSRICFTVDNLLVILYMVQIKLNFCRLMHNGKGPLVIL
jgi:hypothetical protein